MTVETLPVILTVIQMVLSLGIVPLISAMWTMNARIANIEGVLHGLEKQAGGK